MAHIQSFLVTGAGGFIGSALVDALDGHSVRRALRTSPTTPGADDFIRGDIGPETDWQPALRDIDCVVHLAARTHVLRDNAANPLAAYRSVNVDGTRRLAEQAANAGVRRFVFLSSIKVNGETTPSRPFTADDPPAPQDAYGISKLEAENVLREIANRAGMEWVVLRPPLVYGPGVKGNFLQLLKAVARGMPLPLASIDNRRSLIYVGNLVDAILACATHSDAAGKTFLVSDGEDVSSPELARRLATAMGRNPVLLPFPPALLRFGASLIGRHDAAIRLTGSLTIDDSALRRDLGWTPRFTLDQGLKETVQWYHRRQNQGLS